MDSSQLFPAEMLEAAKPLLKSPTRQELQTNLGPPNYFFSKEELTYAFRVPTAVSGLAVDSLRLRWECNREDRCKFLDIQPSFNWTFLGFSDLQLAGNSLKDLRASMVSQYQAFVEKELAATRHIDVGQRPEQCEAILNRLRPTLTKELGPVRLNILQSNTFNACAIRRGREIQLVMYAGLLDQIRDESELAFVMAHELGHMALGHLYVPLDYMVKVMPKVGYHFSQSDEYAADLYAAQLLARAGFNPSACLTFLSKAQERNPMPDEVRFSTHPLHEARRILLSWYLGYMGL